MQYRSFRIFRDLSVAALCGTLLCTQLSNAATTAAGDPNNQQASSPNPMVITAWSERAIRAPVDLRFYSGELDETRLHTLIQSGDSLFRARFTVADGVGRPMATQAIIPTKRKRPPRHQFSRTAGLDANACSSCHNDPVVGGAGDFSVNVFVSEGFQNTDFDNTDPQFSNERNTNHLFGAGLIELLAREMSADLHSLRHQALSSSRNNGVTVVQVLQSKGVGFGQLRAHPDGSVDLSAVEGVDPDLTIRPFGQKGVMTSLRQFTVNALNHHHGMQATERYGTRWTGSTDFDEDNHNNEISSGDVTALVAWQASRPAPLTITPEDPTWQQAAASGNVEFNNIGCSGCHLPQLPLNSLVFHDPGPLDAAGTRRRFEDSHDTSYNLELLDWARRLPRNEKGEILVPLFGDLKRHKIADQEVATLGNELLSQRFVERDVFITGELWGVASTGPYGHRGDLTTMHEVIAAHGGEARNTRDRYMALDNTTQQQIIAFLSTLRLPSIVVGANATAADVSNVKVRNP